VIEPMRVVQLKVGNKSVELAAGLIWHPIHSKGETKTIAKESEFDLAVVRGNGATKYAGFAKKGDGAKKGQIAIAGIIDDVISRTKTVRNYLVAVKIPDDRGQYLFVAVSDGVILADGDLIGTRDEIRVRLSNDSSYEHWDLVVCPADWGVSKSTERTFDDFVNEISLREKKSSTLEDVDVAWGRFAVRLIFIAAIAGGGFWAYKKWETARLIEAEQLRAQQEMIAKGERDSMNAKVKPWPTMPAPKDFSTACANSLKQIGFAAGNWELRSMECTAGNFTATWFKKDEHAWIEHIKQIYPQASVSPDGTTATVTIPAPAVAQNDFQEVIPMRNGIEERYQMLGQRYAIPVGISPKNVAVAAPLLPGQVAQAKAPETATWLEYGVSLTTTLIPEHVIEIFDHPGLRITKISYSLTESGILTYQLTGTQYVN
jgi:hypothetical protein